MVEAAGIEPASVIGYPETSTCLVAYYLTLAEARQRATTRASLTKISLHLARDLPRN